jgi:hypothetical protein
MIAVERNATGIDAAYLHGLSTCFPGAWTEASYRWYLRRPFGSREPDTLSAHDGRHVVSGLGMNYRRLRSASGRLHDVGLLTAAWTLPTHRKRGYYRRLLEKAVEVGTSLGYEALVSFSVEGKPSALALRHFGVVTVPAWYLSLAPTDAFRPSLAPPTGLAAEPADSSPSHAAIAFHYNDPDEWRAQHVDRPHRTTTLEMGDGVAVLEHVDETDRLQFLDARADDPAAALTAMAARAQTRGRHFFSFAADRALAERAALHGLRRVAGWILIVALPNGRSVPWTEARWHVQSGDRM